MTLSLRVVMRISAFALISGRSGNRPQRNAALAVLGLILAMMPSIGFAQEAGASAAVPAVPPVAVPIAGAGLLPADFSAWGMFLHADIVVKLVMVGLIFASVVTWTIWLAKSTELFAARRRISEAFGIIDGACSLAIAADRVGTENHVARTLLQAASEEWRQSVDALDDRGERAHRFASRPHRGGDGSAHHQRHRRARDDRRRSSASSARSGAS
jgi:hypothetical protein